MDLRFFAWISLRCHDFVARENSCVIKRLLTLEKVSLKKIEGKTLLDVSKRNIWQRRTHVHIIDFFCSFRNRPKWWNSSTTVLLITRSTSWNSWISSHRKSSRDSEKMPLFGNHKPLHMFLHVLQRFLCTCMDCEINFQFSPAWKCLTMMEKITSISNICPNNL